MSDLQQVAIGFDTDNTLLTHLRKLGMKIPCMLLWMVTWRMITTTMVDMWLLLVGVVVLLMRVERRTTSRARPWSSWALL